MLLSWYLVGLIINVVMYFVNYIFDDKNNLIKLTTPINKADIRSIILFPYLTGIVSLIALLRYYKVHRYYKIIIHNKCYNGENYDLHNNWSISGIGSSIVEAIDKAFRDYYSKNYYQGLEQICSLDFDYAEIEELNGINYFGIIYYSYDLGLDSGMYRTKEFIKPTQLEIKELINKCEYFNLLKAASLLKAPWRNFGKYSFRWLDKISEKLLSIGLSLKSDYSTLSKNKIFFNKVLRDVLEECPDIRLQHVILSMSDYYEVEQIYELLDEQNRTILKKQLECS